MTAKQKRELDKLAKSMARWYVASIRKYHKQNKKK
jgi:hypothetical protein